MKRIICLITALCIVFGSFSFCFAQDWSATDSQNLQNAASRLYYMNQSAAYYLYNIATNTNNLYNKTVDIYNALFNNGHNITYWVQAISTWMSPIYTAIQSMPSDLSVIQGLLGYPSNDGGGTTWNPYIKEVKNGTTETGSSVPYVTTDANGNIIFSTNTTFYNWQNAFTAALNNITWEFAHNHNRMQYYFDRLLLGETATQNYTDWSDLSSDTFTPASTTSGLYLWLSNIQSPVARLSYVLASDERIAAQEAAAANEEAVVDKFIDNSGDGSASSSDIGSISDLSSGYKSNFGSDAQVTGIFNIFNSNNMGWFSQETVNQLDTTTPTRRGTSFETPLLDQQIYDIYDQIGVKHD